MSIEKWYYDIYRGDDWNRDYYLKGMTLLRDWDVYLKSKFDDQGMPKITEKCVQLTLF